MAWYLRKAFRVGPVRLNLSRNGLGWSAGVRGARVGINARGHPYGHAGRAGLYWRGPLRWGVWLIALGTVLLMALLTAS